MQYILKSPNLIHLVLKNKSIKIKHYKNINNKNLCNYLRRIIQKHYPKKPYTKSNTITLNLSLIKKEIKYDNNEIILYITSLIKRKPIKITLSFNNNH